MYIVLSVQKPSPISFNSVLYKLSQDFLNIKVKKLPKMASSRENFFRLKIRFTSKSLLSPNLMATLPYCHLRWYCRRDRQSPRVRRLLPPPGVYITLLFNISPPPIARIDFSPGEQRVCIPRDAILSSFLMNFLLFYT